METYFKIRTILDFVVPVILVGIIVFGIVYVLTKSWFKARLMKKLGYEYDRGIGGNVAYEYQPHWVKGDTRINCKQIDGRKYSKIKSFVQSKERR